MDGVDSRWIGIFVSVVILLLVRPFWLWYFGINDLERLLEKIQRNTLPADELAKVRKQEQIDADNIS